MKATSPTVRLAAMLLRLRWMTIGAVLALWLGATAMSRLARARRQLSAAGVGREAARFAAEGMAHAADRLRGAATP